MDLVNYFARTRVPYPTELNFNEIRLMALLPGYWTEDICCEVFRVSWVGEPRMLGYKALSYAWGLPSRKNPRIFVNDCPFEVTVNLECALRHLRLPDKDVILWVDALCIDQSNTSERNSQVSRMKSIYSRATEVIVFLGDGHGHQTAVSRKNKDLGDCIVFKNTSTDDCLISQFLSAWTSPAPARRIAAFDIFCLLSILARPRNPSSPFEALEGIPNDRLTAMFEELRRMLTVRWWDRIWVVQEAALARTLTLRYGNVSAPWAMLVDAATAHSQQWSPGYTRSVSGDETKVLSLLSRAIDIDRLRQTREEYPKPNLLSLLREFSNRKASDERDKIYALLGLCNSATGVRPNYSLDVKTAYKVATVDLIKTDSCLSALSGDLGRKNRQDLPSWVPDWSATFDEHDHRRVCLSDKYNACGEVISIISTIPTRFTRLTRFDDLTRSHTHEQMTLLVKSLKVANDPADLLPMCISRALKVYKKDNPGCEDVCDKLISFCHSAGRRDVTKFTSPCSITPDPLIIKGKQSDEEPLDEGRWDEERWRGCLRMRGKHIATVAKTLEPLYSSSDMNAVSDSIIAWSQELGLSKSFGTKEPRNSVSCLGRRASFVATLLSDIKKTTDGLERLKDDDEQAMMNWYRQRIEKVPPDPTEYESTQPSAEVLDAYTEVMRLSVTKRAFFTTQGGQMGLGPASMTVGDQIFVLPGGRLPFVLRRASPPGDIHDYIEVGKTYRLVGDCFLQGAMDGQLSFPREGSLPDKIIDDTFRFLKERWDECAQHVSIFTGLEHKTNLSRDVALHWTDFETVVRTRLEKIGMRYKEMDRLLERMRGLCKDWIELNKGWIYMI